MSIQRRTTVYEDNGIPFEGVIVFDDAVVGPRPGVMVVHNILGQNETTVGKAKALTELGYVGFACDLYGQGKRTTPTSENVGAYMEPLNADRHLLRRRLHASLEELRRQPEVDEARLAAIGFCFGGKGVIDLARSGADVTGVVSFHGVYDRPDYPTVSPMRSKVLVCHGWDDPLAPPDAVVALAQELSAADADWQMQAYGRTGHAFTGPPGTAPSRPGFGYQRDSDRRSWRMMQDFLGELFDRP